MKTINDFLKLFREDQELSDLINNSEALKRDYKERSRYSVSKSIKSKSGRAMEYLWSSFDGIKLRCLLEDKYEVEVGSTKLRGKIKDALHLYIHGVENL